MSTYYCWYWLNVDRDTDTDHINGCCSSHLAGGLTNSALVLTLGIYIIIPDNPAIGLTDFVPTISRGTSWSTNCSGSYSKLLHVEIQ